MSRKWAPLPKLLFRVSALKMPMEVIVSTAHLVIPCRSRVQDCVDLGDALFGSFVGLFVTRIGSADRQLTFRTQTIPL